MARTGGGAKVARSQDPEGQSQFDLSLEPPPDAWQVAVGLAILSAYWPSDPLMTHVALAIITQPAACAHRAGGRHRAAYSFAVKEVKRYYREGGLSKDHEPAQWLRHQPHIKAQMPPTHHTRVPMVELDVRALAAQVLSAAESKTGQSQLVLPGSHGGADKHLSVSWPPQAMGTQEEALLHPQAHALAQLIHPCLSGERGQQERSAMLEQAVEQLNNIALSQPTASSSLPAVSTPALTGGLFQKLIRMMAVSHVYSDSEEDWKEGGVCHQGVLRAAAALHLLTASSSSHGPMTMTARDLANALAHEDLAWQGWCGQLGLDDPDEQVVLLLDGAPGFLIRSLPTSSSGHMTFTVTLNTDSLPPLDDPSSSMPFWYRAILVTYSAAASVTSKPQHPIYQHWQEDSQDSNNRAHAPPHATTSTQAHGPESNGGSHPTSHAPPTISAPAPASRLTTSTTSTAIRADLGLVRQWALIALPGSEPQARMARAAVDVLFQAPTHPVYGPHTMLATTVGTAVSVLIGHGVCRLKDAINDHPHIFQRITNLTAKPPKGFLVQLNVPQLMAAAGVTSALPTAAAAAVAATPAQASGLGGHVSGGAVGHEQAPATSSNGVPIGGPASAQTATAAVQAAVQWLLSPQQGSGWPRLWGVGNKLYAAEVNHKVLKVQAVVLLSRAGRNDGSDAGGDDDEEADNGGAPRYTMLGPRFGLTMSKLQKAAWGDLPPTKKLMAIATGDRYLKLVTVNTHASIQLDMNQFATDAIKKRLIPSAISQPPPTTTTHATEDTPSQPTNPLPTTTTTTTNSTTIAPAIESAARTGPTCALSYREAATKLPAANAAPDAHPAQPVAPVAPLRLTEQLVRSWAERLYPQSTPNRALKVIAVAAVALSGQYPDGTDGRTGSVPGSVPHPRKQLSGMLNGADFGSAMKVTAPDLWADVEAPKVKSLCTDDLFLRAGQWANFNVQVRIDVDAFWSAVLAAGLVRERGARPQGALPVRAEPAPAPAHAPQAVAADTTPASTTTAAPTAVPNPSLTTPPTGAPSHLHNPSPSTIPQNGMAPPHDVHAMQAMHSGPTPGPAFGSYDTPQHHTGYDPIGIASHAPPSNTSHIQGWARPHGALPISASPSAPPFSYWGDVTDPGAMGHIGAGGGVLVGGMVGAPGGEGSINLEGVSMMKRGMGVVMSGMGEGQGVMSVGGDEAEEDELMRLLMTGA